MKHFRKVNCPVFSFTVFVILFLPHKILLAQDYLVSIKPTIKILANEISIQSAAAIGSKVLAVWGTRQSINGTEPVNLLVTELKNSSTTKIISNQRRLHSPEARPYNAVFVVPLKDKFIVFWNDKRGEDLCVAYQAVDTNGLNIGNEGHINGFEFSTTGIKILGIEDGYVLAFNSRTNQSKQEIRCIKLSNNAEVIKIISVKSEGNIISLNIKKIAQFEYIGLKTSTNPVVINHNLELTELNPIIQNSIANQYPIYQHTNGKFSTLDKTSYYEFDLLAANPTRMIKNDEFNYFDSACVWKDTSGKIVIHLINMKGPKDLLRRIEIDTNLRKYSIIYGVDHNVVPFSYYHESKCIVNNIYSDCNGNNVGIYVIACHYSYWYVHRELRTQSWADTAYSFANGYILSKLPKCANGYGYNPSFLNCTRVTSPTRSIITVGNLTFETDYLPQNLEQKNLGLFEQDNKIYTVYYNKNFQKEDKYDSLAIVANISLSGKKSTYKGVSNFVIDNGILKNNNVMQHAQYMNFNFDTNSYSNLLTMNLPSDNGWVTMSQKYRTDSSELFTKLITKYDPNDNKWKSMIVYANNGLSYYRIMAVSNSNKLPSVSNNLALFSSKAEEANTKLLDFIPIAGLSYFIVMDSVITQFNDKGVLNTYTLENYNPESKFKRLFGDRFAGYYTNASKNELTIQVYDTTVKLLNKYILKADVSNGFMITENPADSSVVVVYCGASGGVKGLYLSKNLDVLELNNELSEGIQISTTKGETRNPICIFLRNTMFVTWEENRGNNTEIYFNSWFVPNDIRRAGTASVINMKQITKFNLR